MAEREDYIAYTLTHTAEPFWREVILLEAGYLSTKHRTKTTRLLRAIADAPTEPELFHNLMLAAECLRDVGPTRVEGDVALTLTERLQHELAEPMPGRQRETIRRRVAAMTALSRIKSGTFGTASQHWSIPYGEPAWITIPAGEFWMGSSAEDMLALNNEKPAHRLFVPEFHMARTPITTAQYQLYVKATGTAPPRLWVDGQPPKDTLSHPVVYVSWYDACAYCQWLSQVLGKHVRLPTEAEWEKAARGARDRRLYPWGDQFDALKCNSRELGFGKTSPVGIFLAGASPYGCLDMAGNVWEWASSRFTSYPYDPSDGREIVDASHTISRVLRGGAVWDDFQVVRCAYRLGNDARDVDDFGFRVALAGPP